jgi:hypothetical protein
MAAPSTCLLRPKKEAGSSDASSATTASFVHVKKEPGMTLAFLVHVKKAPAPPSTKKACGLGEDAARQLEYQALGDPEEFLI